MKTTEEKRFWAKVDRRGPDDCWPWLGSTGVGYGHFFPARGRCVGAHRYAYALLVGSIPAGLQLDHTCHDPSVCRLLGTRCPHRRCVNPRHLRPAEPRQNSQRGRRLPIAALPGGSLYQRCGSTLRDARIARGLSQVQLAGMLGVAQPAVSMWESGRSMPRDDRMPAVSAALGVPAADLFPLDEAAAT